MAAARRWPRRHLTDIELRYADVVDIGEVIAYLDRTAPTDAAFAL